MVVQPKCAAVGTSVPARTEQFTLWKAKFEDVPDIVSAAKVMTLSVDSGTSD
jgi:hypothetical protein